MRSIVPSRRGTTSVGTGGGGDNGRWCAMEPPAAGHAVVLHRLNSPVQRSSKAQWVATRPAALMWSQVGKGGPCCEARDK